MDNNLTKMKTNLEKIYTIIIPGEFDLERIDRVLSTLLESDISRSQIQKLIREKAITVNGLTTRPNYRVKTDDVVGIVISDHDDKRPLPENIPLEIIYQDDHIAVINKQPGLVVHPGPGNYGSTLVSALMYHVKELPAAGDPQRPGIVHRLDRDTAGLMVIAKTDTAYDGLVKQFSAREVVKKYTAVVSGKPFSQHAVICRPIGRHKKYRQKMTITDEGREAITEYTVSRIWHLQSGTFSLLDIRIHTGRTHQIRVHLSSIGNPIIGDRIYSKKWEKYKVPFMLLASTHLSFMHPVTGERMTFSIKIPEHLAGFISKLNALEDQ